MRVRTIAVRAGAAAACGCACLAVTLTAHAPAAADGTPAYFARRLGGSGVEPQRVAVGADGTVYVAGRTWTFDLPGTTAPPVPDDGRGKVFVTAFSPGGDARWTTYRQFSQSEYPQVQAMTVGADGALWLVLTQDWPPSDPSAPDDSGDRRFPVVKLTEGGDVAFVTSVTGSGADTPYDIAPTADGDVVIVGTTSSPDFPMLGAFQPQFGGGGLDGFVTRVRGDGSGIAWSTFLGGPDFDGATAVAIDATGDVVVVHHTRGPNSDYYGWESISTWEQVTALDLVRLHADGTYVSETPLPHGERGGVFSLAVAADGSIVAGGNAIFGYADGYSGVRRGFVTRIAPGAAPPYPLWRIDGRDVQRVGVAANGELVVALRGPIYANRGMSVVLLDGALQPLRTLRAEGELGDVWASALAADGTLCVAGRGRELIDHASEPALTRWETFVSTAPLSGVAPPPSLQVRRHRERSMDVTWSDGGDPVVRFELERLEGDGDNARFELVTEVPAEARTAQLDELLPGRTYTMRLVSVFASGARSSVAIPDASTRPRPVTNVRAAPEDGHRIRVSWDNGPVWPSSDYQIERQLGHAGFRRIPSSPWEILPADGRPRSEFFDALPPLDGIAVTYRVRSVNRAGRLRTPWSYSNALTTRPSTLVIRQTSGSVTPPGTDGIAKILVEGTYGLPGRPDGETPFDPQRDILYVTVGDVDRPVGVPVSPFYFERFHRMPGGWYRAYRYPDSPTCGGEDGSYEYYSWSIELNPAQGRFRIQAPACVPVAFKPDADRIVVGLAFGIYSGSDVRTWTKVPGTAPNLVLR